MTTNPISPTTLVEQVADLQSRLACVLEASYWDRDYDLRIAAIRGMCDLSTNGMNPSTDGDATAATLSEQVAAVEALVGAGHPHESRHAMCVPAEAIRAALTCPGTAPAKVRADALREAADDLFDTAMPAFVAQWLRERADRIEREAGA